MTEIKKMNTLKSIDEIKLRNNIMEISVPTACNPGGKLRLDSLIFKDNGALVFKGDFDLHVDKTFNYKDEVSLCNYEFSITGKNGDDAKNAGENGSDAEPAGTLNIDLGTINGNIRIQASAGHGGKGFDGIAGVDGGCGGNGYCGGNGGDGGDATAGTDGGKGGDAPEVKLVYTQIINGSGIYVNTKKIRKNGKVNIAGGTGGEGGKSAEGGKGGIGGKGIDSQHNGSCGSDGRSFPAGKNGDNGAEGVVKVERRPIDEILDNLRGMYVLDFSDEEEREYCLNKLGGPDVLKNHKAVMDAINKSSQQRSDETKSPVKIQYQDSRTSYLTESELAEAADRIPNYKSNTTFGTFSQTYSIDLYDTDSLISDEEAALKWKYLDVQVNAVNKSYATGYPVISQNFSTTDTYGGMVEFCSEILEASCMEGKVFTNIILNGVDGNGNYVYAVCNQEVDNASNKIKYSVQDIKVDNPHWNQKCDDGIMMLYGRMDEQKIYANADYSGGDYYSNTMKSGNKVSTLIPLSGTVTFSSDYKTKGLPELGGAVQFLRPALDYSNKSEGKIDPDVVYQNDLNDKKLRELLISQNCFKANSEAVIPYVEFDFSLDRGDNTSKLDWHHDISGELDNHQRIVLLRGNFAYDISRKDFPDITDTVQISVSSITKENLEMINRNKKEGEKRKYYKFLEGSNLIYIPPIHIYWGCLGKNVLLKTDSGALKRAESVKKGDKLLSHKGKTVIVDHVFTGHDKTIYRLCCDGFETCMSGSHPVLGKNGKGIAVKNLSKGDKIMVENGRMAEVLSVTEEPYNDTVYSFTFEGEKESVYFIADGIYVGDLNAQNEAPEEPQETEDEKERRLELVEEMHILFQEIRSAGADNKK